MNIEKIKEIEEFEYLVRKYVAPFYFADCLGYGRDYAFEKYIDERVLYYMKLGLTIDDMRLKIKLKNERQQKI
jgi:hypothetical protein